MRRLGKWNAQKRDACLSEFRRLMGSHRKEEVRNAVRAGHSLKRLIQDARIIITGIDDVQLERYRRRYAVPQSLKAVMLAVATNKQPERDRKTWRNGVVVDGWTPPKVETRQHAIPLPADWGKESPQVIRERAERRRIQAREVYTGEPIFGYR